MKELTNKSEKKKNSERAGAIPNREVSSNEEKINLLFKKINTFTPAMLTYLEGRNLSFGDAQDIIQEYHLYLYRKLINNYELWLPAFDNNLRAFIMRGLKYKVIDFNTKCNLRSNIAPW